MNLDIVFWHLGNELEQYVAEWARNRVFVHAGVVGWRGQAIVIPGRSMAGKSTLVAALLQAGATYYSDEYAVLDRRGQVHAYPRLLSLRQTDGHARRVRAEELGSSPGGKPLPIGVVALAKYRSGSAWRPRALTPGVAAFELLKHTITTLHAPEQVLTTLHRVAPRVRTLKGERGEAKETAQALLRELET